MHDIHRQTLEQVVERSKSRCAGLDLSQCIDRLCVRVHNGGDSCEIGQTTDGARMLPRHLSRADDGYAQRHPRVRSWSSAIFH